MEQVLRDFLDPAALAAFPLVLVLLLVGWGMWQIVSSRSQATLRKRAAQGVGRSVYLAVHGGLKPYYFDVDTFLADPTNVKLVSTWLQGLLEDEHERGDPIHCLAFIEKKDGPVGSITLKEHFSDMSGLPSVTVRLRKRVLGLSFKPYTQWDHVVQSRARILLLSDVATTGGTLQDAIDKIRRANGR